MPRIAFLDDSDTMRIILARLFDKAGYENFPCETWDQLRKVVEAQPLDLVVLDMQMPKISGGPIAFVLKKKHPNLRIVYLSDSDERYLAQITRQTGADGFIKKSYDGEQILAAIRGHLPADADS